MAVFALIDLDFKKATPLLIIGAAGVGAFFLVRYLGQQQASQQNAAAQDAGGAAIDGYINDASQAAALQSLFGSDPGGTGSTGSTAGNGQVTYSGPSNTPAPLAGPSAPSQVANTAPKWLQAPPGPSGNG